MTDAPSKAELKRNLRALQEHLQARPLDLDARMRVARTYRLLERSNDAIAHYAAVARYLSLAGHPLQAIAVLKELLQLDAKHEDTLLFLAKLYARTRAADVSNRGRIAIPILTASEGPDGGIVTLDHGVPLSATGMWRAISPVSPADLAFTKNTDNVVDRELERLVEDADVIEESDELPTAIDRRRLDITQLQPVADVSFGDDYEIMGHMTTGDLLLPRVPLFESLPSDAFIHLSHAMVFLKTGPGGVVFEEGQPGDSCIVISRGSARVTRSAGAEVIELMQLHEGDIAGLFALMASQTRQATLTAVSDLEYFEIDRDAVDDLVQRHPAVKLTLAKFLRERLLQSVLASLPFFQTLASRERQELVKRFQDRDYQPGDELFFEGAEHDGLWVILEGHVSVGNDASGPRKQLLDLAPGDYVGSLARVDTAAADLSALATTVARVAVLSHKAFSALLEKHQDILEARERFVRAGMMVGEHVFAGNGTMTGQLVGLHVPR